MTAYYNEFDPFAAAWLQKLIAAGHIAPGVVDTRSIEDVAPDDIREFTQCHFFAGIGVWSLALRQAGWADDRPIWTGSCPCQPFSAAGKGNGFADERHLWPAFHWLIEQCEPAVVVGEQVASKDGLTWLDLVQSDMEASGYAFGAADLCAAGFGAPHIRQRTFWVGTKGLAHSSSAGHERRRPSQESDGRNSSRLEPAGLRSSLVVGVAHDERSQIGRGELGELVVPKGRQDAQRFSGLSGLSHGLADQPGCRRRKGRSDDRRCVEGNRSEGRSAGSFHGGGDYRSGPTNGHWANVDWLGCRDGKWRPVEPGTFPLVNGTTNRVGRLRGYGNAIVAPVAKGFIEAVMECLP